MTTTETQTAELPRLTLAMAFDLEYGDILHDREHFNADKTPQRYKVTGRVKTWKKDPSRIYVPMKRGLRGYCNLTEADFNADGTCRINLALGYGS